MPSCSCTPSCWLSTPGKPKGPSMGWPGGPGSPHLHPFLFPLPEKHHLLGQGNLPDPSLPGSLLRFFSSSPPLSSLPSLNYFFLEHCLRIFI